MLNRFVPNVTFKMRLDGAGHFTRRMQIATTKARLKRCWHGWRLIKQKRSPLKAAALLFRPVAPSS